jgi:hydroxymethylglutaryl-CoA lyase
MTETRSVPVLPAQVTVREVSLRDGLQIVARVVPTAAKLAWIRDAYAAGLREFEVGSFVPAHLMPQLKSWPTRGHSRAPLPASWFQT